MGGMKVYKATSNPQCNKQLQECLSLASVLASRKLRLNNMDTKTSSTSILARVSSIAAGWLPSFPFSLLSEHCLVFTS